MYKRLAGRLTSFLKDAGLWAHVRRIWVYKSQVLVADMIYKDVRFAFDLIPVQADRISVDVVQRKSTSSFRVLTLGTKKERLVSSVLVEDGLDAIRVSAVKLFDRIDRYSEASEDPPFSSVSTRRGASGSLNVGVITLPLNKNYGGNLQAFAMMEVVRKLGHAPVLINRRHPPKDSGGGIVAGDGSDEDFLTNS